MQDATKAMQQLNGLEIGGSAIRVQIASVAAGDMGAVTYGELDEEEGTSHICLTLDLTVIPFAFSILHTIPLLDVGH